MDRNPDSDAGRSSGTDPSSDRATRRSFLGTTAAVLGAVGGGSGLAVVGSSEAEAAHRYGIVSTRGHMRVVETERSGQGNQNGWGLPYEIEYTDIAGNPNQCDRDGCQYPQEQRGAARRNRKVAYDAEGNVPGVTDNSPPEEILIATHGYSVTDEDFTSRSDGGFLYDLEKALDGVGYEYPYMGFSWDADFNDRNDNPIPNKLNSFHFFTEDWIAALNGLKLAKFVNWIREEASNTKIRLLGHSLGGRVVLHTLDTLYQWDEGGNNRNAIRSATLLGPAVPRRSVNEGYQDWIRQQGQRLTQPPPYNILINRGSYRHDYHNAIEWVVSRSVENYWSSRDTVLGKGYSGNIKKSQYYDLPENGLDPAPTVSLGGAGAFAFGPPENFEDINVSGVVDDHSLYPRSQEVIGTAFDTWRWEA